MIVLDTHALIWWVNGDHGRFSAEAEAAIADAGGNGGLLVSAISAWEVSMLVRQERLELSMDLSTWLAAVGEIASLRFVPVSVEIAVKAGELPGNFHEDPADRIIVATARKYAVPIVTADEKIHNYRHVRSIW